MARQDILVLVLTQKAGQHPTRRDRHHQSRSLCLKNCQSGGGQGPGKDTGAGIRCREKKSLTGGLSDPMGTQLPGGPNSWGSQWGKGCVSWVSG